MTSAESRQNVTRLPGTEGDSGYRTPPHNFEAEMALLGAILTNNRAYEKVSEFLRPEHFADDRHGRIYRACAHLIERGQMANPITLKPHFAQDDSLEEIGGPEYLARLARAAVSIINAGEYGRLIHDLYLRRQMINIGEDVVIRAYDTDIESSASEQIEEAEKALYDLATSGDYDGRFTTLLEAVTDAVRTAEIAHRREGHISGVATGFRDLDRKLGGLHNSDLVVLAGRPSMGKTALATNIAFNAAVAYRERRGEDGEVVVEEGAKVAFFSLEMSAEQLATRILSHETRISSDKIRRGEVRKDDFPRFIEVTKKLSEVPLFIDDTPGLTVPALRTRARRLKRQHGLGLIVIDYLQLLQPGGTTRPENRVQEISEITRALKALAKELDVPVLALSQLSRAVEQRENKRPQLSDLRESGTIEQDADLVMFVYREQYYHEREEPKQRADETEEKFQQRLERWMARGEKIHNKAEVIVAKNRNGPIGDVAMYFEGEFTRFGDLADEDYLPDAPI